MSEHYDKLLQKTKVKEAIKQNGYVSSETYENIKEQRNQLVRILFSLKEQAKNIQDDAIEKCLGHKINIRHLLPL